MKWNIPCTAAAFAALTTSSPLHVAKRALYNDFDCRSEANPNPVVLLHGLSATYYEDINVLEAYLEGQGFCTFSTTESAAEIAEFMRDVKSKTGAEKIDLVGHSEGAFQTLYVTKFGGVKDLVQRVFAIAPPTHGTTFLNLYNVTGMLPQLTRPLVDQILDTAGCDACSDLLPNGQAVAKLSDGPIAQEGVRYTILISKYDELVTPTTTSFVYEDGVRNLYVQDFGPNDPVRHIGEAYDSNVMELVSNTLKDDQAGPKVCVAGSPGK